MDQVWGSPGQAFGGKCSTVAFPNRTSGSADMLRFFVALMLAALPLSPARAAEDVLDAIDQARKAYQSGDLSNAKQSLDLASQLIGQKNAEAFAALLPNALPGWKAEKPET